MARSDNKIRVTKEFFATLRTSRGSKARGNSSSVRPKNKIRVSNRFWRTLK